MQERQRQRINPLPETQTKAKAMPPKVKAKAKAKALPKAAGKAKVKAKARVASRRAGLLRKRPARAPLDGAGSPCASPVPEPELFAPVAESRFRREGKYHIKGKYLGVDAEAAVKIDSLVEDSLGKWAQVTLLGTNHDSLREWRLQSSAPLFISRVGVTTDQQVMDQELFYTREVGEIDEKITWITNLKDHGSTGGLSGINQLARELGYGGGQGVGPRERTPGGADPASPASPTKPSKKKRLRGRERVKAMLKDSQWSWKNSALDPRFKRPKIRLKRKKDKSSSSSTTETEKSNDSEEEDLFPEEDQIKYIHRKCPGLLTRHGIKQAKCRVLALQGEGGEGKNPEPVFVRYHRQIFAPQNPSAPLKREHLTLSTVLDCILRGEILKGSDILTQRLKSLEQIAHGAPAHLALKLEILPPESTTLASIEESRTAATQHHRELKVAEVWKGKGKQGSWGPSPPLTPGNTKGLKGNKGSGAKGIQGKGDKGDRGSKGEQSGRTAIVAPT